MPSGVYKRTKEHGRKISVAGKAYYKSHPERKKGKNNPHSYFGTKTGLCLKECLYQIFEQNEQRHLPDKLLQKQLLKEFPTSRTVHNISINEFRGVYNQGLFGLPKTISKCYGQDGTVRTAKEETQRKMSVTAKMLWPEQQKRLQTKKARRKKSKAAKKNWQDPKYAKKVFAHKSPNKSELKLQTILNKLFPKEYKFVGNGQVVLGGKLPDFINVNGQKKIIEMFGTFYHSKKFTGKPLAQ